MPPKKKSSLTPQIPTIRLVGLEDGDTGLLDAHENVDGLRFVGADVSGQDLSGLTVTECAFEDLDAHDVLLRGAGFVETTIERLNAPIIAAPRSRFREVSIDQSRIGSAEFYESNWRSVHITGSKLGFVNLRGAVLQDVQFTNCSIDELDLGGATVNRLAFVDCTLNSLDVTRATLQNVDLRTLDLRRISGLEGLKGATMSSMQVSELASMFAEHLGIVIDG